jgi:hypothetical protein
MAKTTILMLSLTVYLGGFAGVALAQNTGKTYDPNLRNFYMGRQEIQIIDDGPVINDQRTAPGAPGGNGALPANPAPLPKAGWQQYSPAKPMNMGPLPKVENGVPKAPPPDPAGLHGKSARIKPVAKAPAAPSGPKSYKPYAGYGGSQAAPPSGYGSSSNNSQSSSNVKGSVLHWARSRRTGY